jgi:hypothetical protein
MGEVVLEIHGILKKKSFNITSRLDKLRFQPHQRSKINIFYIGCSHCLLCTHF